MGDFVTLKKCFSQIEAHQLKNLLENEGIFCQLMNETISQLYNFHTPADGGVLLMVHKKDLISAQEVLDSNVRMDLLTENLWKSEVRNAEPVDRSPSKRVFGFYTAIVLLILLAILAVLFS